MSGRVAALVALVVVGPVEVWGQERGGSRQIVTAGAPAVLAGHERRISEMTFSPDGAILASVDSKALWLWNAATGQPIRTIATGNPGLAAPAFSPDGALLAINDSGAIRVWEVATGRELAKLPGVGAEDSGPVFLPDGRTILGQSTTSWPSPALFDALTGKELRLLDKGMPPGCMAVAPDGRVAAVATSRVPGDPNDKPDLALLDLVSGKYRRSFPGVDFETSHLAFTPNGRLLIAGGGHATPELLARKTFVPEGALKVWEVGTGRLVGAMPYGLKAGGSTHPAAGNLYEWITEMALSPDGSTVAVGGALSRIDFWSVSPLEQVGRISDGHGNYTVTALAFSPDGRTLARAEEDMRPGFEARRISLLVIPTGRGRGPVAGAPRAAPAAPAAPAEVVAFRGHPGSTDGVAFSRDGRLVLSGGDDKVARLWEADTGTERLQLVGHDARINSVAFSRDGKSALTAADDKSARLWDLVTGREVRRFDGHEGGLTGARFSPDGTKVASASWDHTARLWDLNSGKELRTYRGHGEGLIDLAFAPDGRTLYTASWDRTARAWDVATGKKLRAFRGHDGRVGHIALSTDGRRLLTSSDDRTLRFWDAASTKELARVDVGADCGWAVALAADNRHALTVDNADVTLWDLQTRTPPIRLAVKDGQVHGLALSPDGRSVAITTAGGAHVWSLPRLTTPAARR